MGPRKRSDVTPLAQARWLLVGSLVVGAGCLGDPSDLPPVEPLQTQDIVLGDGDIVAPQGDFGLGLGESCEVGLPCRPGLVCSSGMCTALGDRSLGGTCFISAECDSGLVCSIAGVCLPQGASEVGDGCAVTEDCVAGLYCAYTGFSGTCAVAGQADVYQPCGAPSECQSGLVCDGLQSLCYHPSQLVEEWLTLRDCEDLSGRATAVFEVPRAGDSSDEYYRLPFPNDARRAAGHVELGRHPSLQASFFGFDPVARILDAVAEDTDAYSTAAPALFRLTDEIDITSVTAGKDKADQAPVDTLALVDIDPDSPDYGTRMPLAWSLLTGDGSQGRYICQDWVSIRPLWVRPLREGTTYAAVILHGLRSKSGQDYKRDTDFQAVMSDSAPSDEALLAAWEAYAPLRTFTNDGTVEVPLDRDRVVSAAVFTTATSADRIVALRDSVAASLRPSVENWTLCRDGVVSPCEDASKEGPVSCGAESPHFSEFHSRIQLPLYQQGTPPYLEPGDGGAVEWDDGGEPIMVGVDDVCVAVSIPRGGVMPSDGWPVAMFAHGTGGRFTSPMRSGLAAALAQASWDGVATPTAVVSIDGVQHGPRRGDSDEPPEILFFNIGNPLAAKGNALQGIADYFAVEQWLIGPGAEPGAGSNLSVGDKDMRFDPASLFFIGHSQGANVGVPFVARSKHVRATVFSGAGGGLSLSMLYKTEPVDVAAGLGYGLGDVGPNGESRVSDHHPIMGLLQHLFHDVDPLTHAPYLFRLADADAPAKHVLHIWGNGDSYSPDATIKALAGAARVVQAAPANEDVPGAALREPPIRGSHGSITAVIADYENPNGDGHFALFDVPEAMDAMTSFLASVLVDEEGVPSFSE